MMGRPPGVATLLSPLYRGAGRGRIMRAEARSADLQHEDAAMARLRWGEVMESSRKFAEARHLGDGE